MGDASINKVAVFINRSTDKATIDDMDLVHRGMKADGYRTIVFSPVKPQTSAGDYTGQDILKLKEAINRFIRAGKSNKIAIYFGGMGEKASVQCDPRNAEIRRNLLQMMRVLMNGSEHVLTGPSFEREPIGMTSAIATLFPGECAKPAAPDVSIARKNIDILKRTDTTKQVHACRVAQQQICSADVFKPVTARGVTQMLMKVPVLNNASSDKDLRVRLAAVEALGNYKTEAAAIALNNNALVDKDPRVRLAAVKVLASNGTDAAADALKTALDDREYNIRSAAVQALGRIKTE